MLELDKRVFISVLPSVSVITPKERKVFVRAMYDPGQVRKNSVGSNSIPRTALQNSTRPFSNDCKSCIWWRMKIRFKDKTLEIPEFINRKICTEFRILSNPQPLAFCLDCYRLWY